MFQNTTALFKATFHRFYFQSLAKCCSDVVHNTSNSQNVISKTIKSAGQATSYSHPHLLKDGELLPGINKYEFRLRRNKLVEKIKNYDINTQSQIIIIPSATKVYMSDKIPYVFRQNTEFLYFTGCQEPDSVAVLIINGSSYSTVLFVRPKDAHSELWDGPRTGVDDALHLFDVEQTLPVAEFNSFVKSFLSQNRYSTIWYDSVDIVQPEIYQKMTNLLKITNKTDFSCPKQFMHQIRLIKSESEINLMKKSCNIASEAISKTISITRPGISEHHLFATVDYECRMRGAELLAYPPVVAAGNNANTIHYIINNQIVKNNELVLMDAGCEYHSYSSDITRTWPANGKFSPEQKILYEIVLEVQKKLIEKYREMPTLDMVYHDMCILLGKYLQEECIVSKLLTGNELLSVVYSLCPHHVSHYLGMDVHDTPKVSRSIKLQHGTIVTVEPGLYLPDRNKFVPKEFRNIGIRIEDDILIQDDGPFILSKNCPKEVEDIESIAQQNQE